MNFKSGLIKLKILSGKASPAPPVGPALGQKGLNIVDFCKKFNDYTKNYNNFLVSVKIIFFTDKSYIFFCKKLSVSSLVKDLLKIDKINSLKNDLSLSFEDVINITKYKISDLNTDNFFSAFNIIYSNIKSMGINVFINNDFI